LNIRSIQIRSFRNLKDQTVHLSPGINVLVGDNGQGKTNFLEAIHLLATLKSFRSSKNREVICHSCHNAEIESSIAFDETPLSLRLIIEKSGRRMWVGENLVSKVGDYLGCLNVVAFTPDDLSMIKGSPATRRRFLDRSSFLFVPSHINSVRGFNASLKARNRLLSKEGSFDYLQVESFTQTLSAYGHKVSTNRSLLMERISFFVGDVFNRLYPDCKKIEVNYKAGWSMNSDSSSEDLFSEVMENLPKDRQRGMTCIGPQQDDFEALLGDFPVRRFASQGQQRTVAVSLLLAVFMAMVEEESEPPVILLDDVSSELDKKCRTHLFEQIVSLGGQVLVTTTDETLVEALGEATRFEVTDGLLKKRA
jgi:DNA replication and repair protein RecF